MLAALVSGCIKNNIPYPRIKVNFTQFEVQQSLRPAAIDSVANTVTLYLDEEADLTDVVVDGFAISPATAQWPDSAAFLNGIDLTTDVTTELELYQKYEWTISARQEIERYFTVEQQVGSSVIDVPGRRVIAYVSASAPIRNLTVTSIKLGARGSVMNPDLSGRKVDFSVPVEVTVTTHGRPATWTLYVLPTESSVTTQRVDAWSCVAWLYGSGEAGRDNGFEYRRADSDQWLRMATGDVTSDGGSFTGRLTGLTPETEYVARAYSGSDLGAEIVFTTQGTAQMPNSDFDSWWLDGKVWDPWAEGALPIGTPATRAPRRWARATRIPPTTPPRARGSQPASRHVSWE